MADFQQMLRDRVTYPDGMEITAPNGDKVRMGDFRSAYNAREEQLNRKENDVQAARVELATVYQNLSEEREALNRRAAELGMEADKRTGPRDEYTGGIQERIDKLAAAQLAIQDKLVAMDGTLKVSVDTFLRKEWGRDAEAVKKEFGLEDADVGTLLRFAVDHGLTDANKIPDLRRAGELMSEPKRREKEIKEAEERGRRAAEQDATMRALGRPVTAMRGVEVTPTERHRDLNAAFDAAVNDPEIWSGISN